MTARQFYIILFIFTVSLKVQKLPCFIYPLCEKDSYLQILLFMVLEIIFILVAFLIIKVLKRERFFSYEAERRYSIPTRVGMVFIAVYFLIEATLFYVAIQNLFSHVLFDRLPWAVFSILLIVCVFYLAASGINNISRSFELYGFTIIISYLIIAILGAMHTDFTVIFPLEAINYKGLLQGLGRFNIWFGDAFIILFLGFNAKNIKLKWTLLVYVLAMCFVSFLIIEFNGLFEIFSKMQSDLISVISEQAMLGLEIGRVDWFLILLTEVGTILCCGLCLHCVKRCLVISLPKVNSNFMLAGAVLVLYIVDIFVFVDTNVKEKIFFSYNEAIVIVVKLTVFVTLLTYSLWKIYKNKKKKQKEIMEKKGNEKTV